jgi:hypothetical protein
MPGALVEVTGAGSPYVGRGGEKLAGALDQFQVDPSGMVCFDVGGFTDCLLQRGAARVYAVDVGYGQFEWRLRQDPRVVLMERTNVRYLEPGAIPEPIDLIVIDAYSSDAIPIHLMTTDAMRVYLDRLAPEGVLAFHISNRFFDLEPVLARIARDLGLNAWGELHDRPEAERIAGEQPSQVVVMARDAARLTDLVATGQWRPLQSDDKAAWSDDYSNLLGALR